MRYKRKEGPVYAHIWDGDLFELMRWLAEECGLQKKATSRIGSYGDRNTLSSEKMLCFRMRSDSVTSELVPNNHWLVFDEGEFYMYTEKQFQTFFQRSGASNYN